MTADNLGALARSLTGPFAFCGIAAARAGSEPEFFLSAPGREVTPRTLFRCASVSKVVTGWTARMALVRGRDGINPAYRDVAVEDVLGQPFAHPALPDHPITVGQLAGHCSGLSDKAGYAIAPGVAPLDWITAQGTKVWADHAPGQAFEYCNLGYIVLAAVAEVEAQERFDTLARRLVLDPLDIEGGFNWSGVLSERRPDRIATYRRDDTGLHPQIDAVVATGGISAPDGTAPLTGAYRLGTDVSVLSPQGGLRLSMAGMMKLARALPRGPAGRLWSPDRGPTPDEFDSYGWGIQFLDSPGFFPRPIVGHFANAYGFAGGIWYDRETDTAFAYALNGLPLGDEDDALRPEEQQIFAAVAAWIG